MLVRLPLGVPEPDTRLRLIASRTRMEKERAREQGTLEFMRGPRGAWTSWPINNVSWRASSPMCPARRTCSVSRGHRL
ncbi:hypothetical protein [Arthrobacter sp. AQ5-05]|uniref:hypothetical protein n=1 Tax=Arthrobacter sp. AQ5-05 TaxID=2184581 RepID=UPI002570C583|nr:hypothetical protein [Arthrobacter sp. AQ5-05]